MLAAGELHTGGLFLGPFAIGALAGMVLSLVGAGTLAALVAFVVISVAVLVALRPVARRHRRLPARLRSGAAALVGRSAVVMERISNGEGVGCVKIDGEVWTARSYDDDEVIDRGEKVEVVEIRGATAMVVH